MARGRLTFGDDDELGTALARVKKLERIIDSGRDLLEDVRAEKHAAETALASARADLNIALSAAADMRTAADQRAGVRGRVKVHVETRLLPALSRLYDTLTSHPAPVAARTFEHPGAEEVFNTLQAARKAPVAAPCAGCEEALKLLQRCCGDDEDGFVVRTQLTEDIHAYLDKHK